MTDMEMLVLAAKAMGLKHVDYTGLDYDGKLGLQLVDGIGRHTESWNPLETDCPDAFHLAIRLRLGIEFYGGIVEVCWFDSQKIETQFIQEPINDAQDERTATRRAITRAAADMGSKQ